MNKFIKGVLFDLIIVLLVINSVYSYLLSTQLYSRIFNITSQNFISTLNNFDSEINDIYNQNPIPAKDFLELYKDDKPLKNFINRSLKLFLVKNIVHIFIVTKRGHHFVYIANGKEPVIPGLPFMPDKYELKNVFMAYNNDKPVVYKHNKIFNIGFSLYYPIDVSNKYRALVVLDYSNEFKNFIDRSMFIQRYVSFSLLLLALFSLFYMLYAKLNDKRKKLMLSLDPLTGVFNRRYIKLMEDIHKDYTIAMVDIDHFKSINDTYGHHAGDMVIKKVAEIIKQSLRNEDIIIRYGGEEFLIFIKNYEDSSICNIILNRIRENIEKAVISLDGIEVKITVSIGALLDGEDLPLEERIKIADKFLYEAKNSGRNKVICGKV